MTRAALCNGGNHRPFGEYVHAGVREHEPVRLHMSITGVRGRCPICGRVWDGFNFNNE
jgi:hypothetical protein